MKIFPGIANLSDTQLKEVRVLEKKLGVVLVGYEIVPEVARLSTDQIENLKQMEKKTGTLLVAYKE